MAPAWTIPAAAGVSTLATIPTGPEEDRLAELGRLYDRLAGPLFRHAAMMLASRSDAADVVQRVFVRLLDRGLHDIEALDLLDAATARTFAGFSSGTAYSEQIYQLERLSRLCTAQTAYAAATGDRVGAVASLRAELALVGDHTRPVLRTPFPKLLLSALDLSLMLNRDALTAGDLDTLSGAFARADDNDLLWRTLDGMRAGYISTFLRRAAYGLFPSGTPRLIGAIPGQSSVMLRPLSAQDLLQHLAVAIRRQWRDDAGFLVDHGWSEGPWGFTSRPLGLSSTRVARAAIAVERYRLAHRGELPATLEALVPAYLPCVPIDPYSGQPVHYVRVSDGYEIYGVSFDRKDDGGDALKDLPVIRVTVTGR